MFHSTESDSSSSPNVCVIEQALQTLRQTIMVHLERETQLERLYLGWQQKWLSQCDQMRQRIESLEARLSPWIVEQAEGPRLAVISQHEDVA